MSLAFIGLSKDAQSTQVRTAGLWNIAVALDRLREDWGLPEQSRQNPLQSWPRSCPTRGTISSRCDRA